MAISWSRWCLHLVVSSLAICGVIAFSGDWSFGEITPNATLKAKPIYISDDRYSPPPDNKFSISLKCYQTASNTGIDQISMEIDYQPVWGPDFMQVGGEVNLNEILFHNSVRIEVFVHDANGTKTSLGSRTVLATRGESFTLKRNGAQYMLAYKVGAQNSDSLRVRVIRGKIINQNQLATPAFSPKSQESQNSNY